MDSLFICTHQTHPDRSLNAPPRPPACTRTTQHALHHRMEEDAAIHPRCILQACSRTVLDLDPDDVYAQMVERGISRQSNSRRRMGLRVGKGGGRKRVLGGHFGCVLQQILSAVAIMVAVVSAQKGKRIDENLMDEIELNTHFHRAWRINRAYLLLLLPVC